MKSLVRESPLETRMMRQIGTEIASAAVQSAKKVTARMGVSVALIVIAIL